MMLLKAVIKKFPSVHTICHAGTKVSESKIKSEVHEGGELIGNLAAADAIFNLLVLHFSFSEMQEKFEIGETSH